MSRIRSEIDSTDIQHIVSAPDELREAGVELEDIEIVPENRMVDKVKEAKFMEEKVIIEIEADDDPNAPEFVYTGHNGVSQYIHRGRPQAIKRKYLYALLSAKRIKMACAFGIDANRNEFNRLSASGQTTHRFRLIRDDNPEGGSKWFARVANGLC